MKLISFGNFHVMQNKKKIQFTSIDKMKIGKKVEKRKLTLENEKKKQSILLQRNTAEISNSDFSFFPIQTKRRAKKLNRIKEVFINLTFKFRAIVVPFQYQLLNSYKRINKV